MSVECERWKVVLWLLAAGVGGLTVVLGVQGWRLVLEGVLCLGRDWATLLWLGQVRLLCLLLRGDTLLHRGLLRLTHGCAVPCLGHVAGLLGLRAKRWELTVGVFISAILAEVLTRHGARGGDAEDSEVVGMFAVQVEALVASVSPGANHAG
jgi:hypothetical protein